MNWRLQHALRAPTVGMPRDYLCGGGNMTRSTELLRRILGVLALGAILNASAPVGATLVNIQGYGVAMDGYSSSPAGTPFSMDILLDVNPNDIQTTTMGPVESSFYVGDSSSIRHAYSTLGNMLTDNMQFYLYREVDRDYIGGGFCCADGSYGKFNLVLFHDNELIIIENDTLDPFLYSSDLLSPLISDGNRGGDSLFSDDDPTRGYSVGIRLTKLSSLAVPEPASWAMMLGGFGMVGGAIRARRKTAASFA